MVKLKKDYLQVYNEIKCKLIILFVVFIMFLLFRFFLFMDIEYWHIMFNKEQDAQIEAIPFYLTEVAITITISYILISISNNN